MQQNPPQGFVDAGNIASFAPGLRSLYQEDVLNSNLLAQLAADKQFSRLHEAAGWSALYQETLGKLAWNLSASERQIFTPPEPVFTMEEVVVAALGKHLDEGAIALLKEQIASLRALPRCQPPASVFEDFTHDAHLLNVGVLVVTSAQRIWSANVTLTTRQYIYQVFCEYFAVSLLEGDVNVVTTEHVLNEALYSTIRQEVIRKLGDKRTAFIMALQPPVESETQRWLSTLRL